MFVLVISRSGRAESVPGVNKFVSLGRQDFVFLADVVVRQSAQSNVVCGSIKLCSMAAICTHRCLCQHVFACACVCVHLLKCVLAYVRACVSMCLCPGVCGCVCGCGCVCVRMRACITSSHYAPTVHDAVKQHACRTHLVLRRLPAVAPVVLARAEDLRGALLRRGTALHHPETLTLSSYEILQDTQV